MAEDFARPSGPCPPGRRWPHSFPQAAAQGTAACDNQPSSRLTSPTPLASLPRRRGGATSVRPLGPRRPPGRRPRRTVAAAVQQAFPAAGPHRAQAGHARARDPQARAHADLEVAPWPRGLVGTTSPPTRTAPPSSPTWPGGPTRAASSTCGQQEAAPTTPSPTCFSPVARLTASANWWAVAHVHPDPDALARLTDGQTRRRCCPPRSASCKGFRKCSFYPGRSRNSTGGP